MQYLWVVLLADEVNGITPYQSHFRFCVHFSLRFNVLHKDADEDFQLISITRLGHLCEWEVKWIQSFDSLWSWSLVSSCIYWPLFIKFFSSCAEKHRSSVNKIYSPVHDKLNKQRRSGANQLVNCLYTWSTIGSLLLLLRWGRLLLTTGRLLLGLFLFRGLGGRGGLRRGGSLSWGSGLGRSGCKITLL